MTRINHRQAVRLQDYLDAKLGTGLGKGNREYHCPFCMDRVGSVSAKPKLRIDVTSGLSFCLRCNYSAGSLKTLLRGLTRGRLGLDELSLLRQEQQRPEASLADTIAALRAGTDEPGNDGLIPVPVPIESTPLTDGQSWLVNHRQRRAAEYLESRGVGVEEAHRYAIRYADRGRFSGYLIFPIPMHGVPVYWTNRFAGECPPTTPLDRFRKTWNHRGEEGDYGKADVLFGHDQSVGQRIVGIGEGPFDAMALAWVCGGGVGLLGKLPSQAQLALLSAMVAAGTEEFVIGLDPDATRDAEALHSALVDIAPRVSFITFDHGDPASRRADLPELLEQRTARRSLVDRVRLRLFGSK